MNAKGIVIAIGAYASVMLLAGVSTTSAEGVATLSTEADGAGAETALVESRLSFVGRAAQVSQPENFGDHVAGGATETETARPSSILVLSDGRMFEQSAGSEPHKNLLAIMDEITTEAEAAAVSVGQANAVPEMQHPKVIIGDTDSRFRVSASSLENFPYRAIGRIGGCTGTLIGPRHVLTAAHCLHDDEGNWYWPLSFRPGVDGDEAINGEARRVVARRAYVGYKSNRAWDVGLMILEDAPETAALGRLGFWYYDDPDTYSDRVVFNFGYPLRDRQCPGQTCDGHMWGMSCKLELASTGGLRHVCDTQDGHSGSPIYEVVDGSRRILGVHWGSPGGGVNGAARMRPEVASDLCTWMSWWPSTVGTMPRCALR